MTREPEHTCHDEYLEKAREILEHLENFPDGSIVLIAVEPIAGYQLDKKTIKGLCSAVIKAAGRKSALPPFKQFQIGAALNGIAMTKAKMLYYYLASQIEGEK